MGQNAKINHDVRHTEQSCNFPYQRCSHNLSALSQSFDVFIRHGCKVLPQQVMHKPIASSNLLDESMLGCVFEEPGIVPGTRAEAMNLSH
jgi:hypothetical protein